MQPETFAGLVSIIERHQDGVRLSAEEVSAAIGDRASPAREAAMYRAGDTAVIPIRGVIARYADQINGSCQDSGRSAESIQSDLRAAVGDLQVKRIVLRIDSPGGTVAGTAETAAAIKAAAAIKPVHAYVDGLAASAAYWLASSADTITASAPTAQVGSIGVIAAHVDETAAQERRGYRVHVIRSVALKAPGTAGESLSAEQIDSIQRNIAQLHGAFASAVAAARHLDPAQLATVTTGEVWAAESAKAHGLIDGMQGWDSFIASISTMRGAPRASNKASAMNIDELDAITSKHPEKARDVIAMAKAGKSAPEIEAHLVEAAKAEEVAAIKAACDTALADLKAEKEAHAKTAADLKAAQDQVAAIKANNPAHEDPGQGKGEFRRSAMSLAEKSKFIRANGRETFEALPE